MASWVTRLRGEVERPMWVGTRFPGDTNDLLKWVQHDLYWSMVVRVYSLPRDRYLDACRLIQTNTDLAIRLRSMEGFDHRTLQDIHDLVAAWFRFTKDNGGQLLLGETEEKYKGRLAGEWRSFFEEEIGRLVDDDEFVRNVLVATAFGNTDRGYAAEAQLRELLRERYSTMKKPVSSDAAK